MPTTTTRRRPKNPHAVALRRLHGKTPPLAIYGDLTTAQRREHYSWVRRVGMARAAGRPAPPPPPWIIQRKARLRYGYNEYAARLLQADATAWRGYQSLIACIEQLRPNLQTVLRANLAVIARGILDMLILAGCAEPEKSEVARSLQAPLPPRG